MRIFPVIVRRITQAIGSVLNFHGDAKPAPVLSAVLDTRGSTIVRPAPAIPAYVGALAVKETPAVALGPVLSATERQSPAPALTSRATMVIPETPAVELSDGVVGALAVAEIPAAQIVQVRYDLNHASHVVTADVVVGATVQWINPANDQGAPDGTDSTFDGNTLLLAVGTLRGTHVAQPARGNLIIDQVWLDFYGQVTGLPVASDLVSSLKLQFSTNNVLTMTLDTISTGASNFHATPRSFRIDDGAGHYIDALATTITWADLSTLFSYWNATIILGLVGAHYRADAVRLRVIAHETEAL